MTSSTSWNPALYLQFEDHRLRPALDLLNRIPLQNADLVCDLGCGAGNVMSFLAQRWPQAQIIGIDHSAEMLERARREYPQFDFQEADAGAWKASTPADIIYSNAALHWLPDHRSLFPRLVKQLKAGGCLAVQMPANFKAPSHTLIRDVLDDLQLWNEELRRALGSVGILDAADYYDILAPHTGSLDIWQTEYMQCLQGEDPVLNWVRASALRPVFNCLSPDQSNQFLNEYKQRLSAAYPRRGDGSVLFPFKRLFIVARI